MKKSIVKVITLAGTLLATGAQANAITFNFDALASNASANADPVAQANGISFLSGFVTDDLDIFGDPIPGQTHIEAYADSDIRVVDPAAFGRGPAPSGTNAINTLFDQLLIRFAAPIAIDGFGFSEDPSSFGDLFSTSILLLDANGKTLFTVGPYTPNSNGGHRYDYTFASAEVSQILLSSSSKLFDDISISATAVPEPEIWLMMVTGFGLIGAMARRRGRKLAASLI